MVFTIAQRTLFFEAQDQMGIPADTRLQLGYKSCRTYQISIRTCSHRLLTTYDDQDVVLLTLIPMLHSEQRSHSHRSSSKRKVSNGYLRRAIWSGTMKWYIANNRLRVSRASSVKIECKLTWKSDTGFAITETSLSLCHVVGFAFRLPKHTSSRKYYSDLSMGFEHKPHFTANLL
jgi:hypothetical protein